MVMTLKAEKCSQLRLSFSAGCEVMDGLITWTDDKELCEEDKAFESVTTVVNKHLTHVTPHKQVSVVYLHQFLVNDIDKRCYCFRLDQ